MIKSIKHILDSMNLLYLSFKTFVIFVVNSISWAPPEYGLMLACGSSDGSISIISSSGENCKDWQTSKALITVLVVILN